jgi:hypothetical protein
MSVPLLYLHVHEVGEIMRKMVHLVNRLGVVDKTNVYNLPIEGHCSKGASL